MKLRQKSTVKLKYILLTLVILFTLGVGYCWYYNYFSAQSKPTEETTPTEAPTERDIEYKKTFIESENSIKQNPETTSSAPDKDTQGAMKIDSRIEKTNVVITTKISGIGDGICKISIKNGDTSFTDTANIIYHPSYSTCAGFTIPIGKLKDGTWNITITATSINGQSLSQATQKEVSL